MMVVVSAAAATAQACVEPTMCQVNTIPMNTK
eukprot:COSAG01_NODE_44360_length_420_cov_0.451713_1_plen_31_part_01